MNIEEIDKWLDNEYGTSYTRLEELHDYFFEKYTDQKEEIKRLNNVINELEEYICVIEYDERNYNETWQIAVRIHNKLKELKGSDKE